MNASNVTRAQADLTQANPNITSDAAVSTAETSNTDTRERRGRMPKRGTLMRLVRRMHMYLGLLLFPWVLLYGVSGVLYNHPQIGRSVSGQFLPPPKVRELTGFDGWKAAELAAMLVERLNQSAAGYTLDDTFTPAYAGWAMLASPASDGGKYVAIVNLDKGGAIVAKHEPREDLPDPPFAVDEVPVNGRSMRALEQQFAGLLPGVGADAVAPLRAHPSIAPELRFRVRDAHGVIWNVDYNLRTMALDGRRTNDSPPTLVVELLEKLHQQHHFPANFGATFWWALLADMTGLTMALWALTGIAMWWQLKKTRLMGALSIAIALGLGAWIMGSTIQELEFNPEVHSGPR